MILFGVLRESERLGVSWQGFLTVENKFVDCRGGEFAI